MKSSSLPVSIGILLLPVLVFFVAYWLICRYAGVMPIPSPGDANEVAKAGVEFAKDLQALALAALGALGAFLFKVSEQSRLGTLGRHIGTISIGFLTAAIYLGYEAQVSALRLWSDTGGIVLDEGPYHWAVSMQVVALSLGAACYGLLILCLIQPAHAE